MAKKNREQDLSRLNAQEAIRNAVFAYQARYGKWPTGKSEISGLVRFTPGELSWIKTWDCKLKSANRTKTVSRYSIMIDGEWSDWDAKVVSPLERITS